VLHITVWTQNQNYIIILFQISCVMTDLLVI
jgi:hypothetical protein